MESRTSWVFDVGQVVGYKNKKLLIDKDTKNEILMTKQHLLFGVNFVLEYASVIVVAHFLEGRVFCFVLKSLFKNSKPLKYRFISFQRRIARINNLKP